MIGALLGSGPGDYVPDPYGGPLAGYQATASLLDRLISDLVAQCLAEEPALLELVHYLDEPRRRWHSSLRHRAFREPPPQRGLVPAGK